LENSLSNSGKWYSEKIYLESRPGTVNEYSNIGFALAGYLVEVISGKPFNEYCNENIFDPLRMDDTRWFLSELDTAKIAIPYQFENGEFSAYPHYGFPSYPDGQLKSNVVDLLSFLQFFLNNGEGYDVPVLQAATIEEILRIQEPDVDYGQALGWSYSEFNLPIVNNAFLPAKGGEDPGARAIILFDPISKSGFVILLNQELKDFWTEQREICFDLVNKLKADLGLKNMHGINELRIGSIAAGIAVVVVVLVWLVIPKQICPHCGHKFHKFERKCPKCRVKRQ